jgi:hypothetical protein
MLNGLRKLNDKRLLMLAFLGVYYAALAIKRGAIVYEDAAQYRGWALDLIERGYDVAVFLRDVTWDGGDIRMYLSWIALIALLIQAFGDAWATAIVAMNVAWYVLAAIIMLRLVDEIDTSRAAAPIAIGFMFVLWDYYYWASHVLADSSVNLMAIGVLAVTAKAVGAPTPGKAATGLGLALLVAAVALTFKPQAIAVFAFVLGATILTPVLRIEDSRELALRLKIGLAAGLALCGSVAYAVGAAAADPSIVSAGWLRDMIISQVQDYGRDGSIIWQRYETYIDPPKSALDYALMFALRALYMFAPFARDYSLAHKTVNTIGLLPLYALALAGLWAVLSGHASVAAQKLGALALIMIVALVMLHALTAVDYDWRYRVPLFGPMLVLAVIGWERLIAILVRAR